MSHKAILRSLFLAVVTGLFMPSALGQEKADENSIESLDVLTPPGQIIVKFSLEKAPTAPPVSFTLANPPRIALDFANTENGLGRNVQSVGQGGLQSIRLGESSGRTRVVLNMTSLVGYETKVNGKTVDVILSVAEAAGSKTAPTSAETVTFATGVPAAEHSIRDVHFQRGRGGEGKIIVDLSDNGAGIDLRRQGRNIVVEFVETELPPALERRYDVTDFGTLVDGFDIEAFGSTARLTILARGNWEQAAYQADNRFIIEVKAVVEQDLKAAKASQAKYKGEKLSLNFQSIEVQIGRAHV